MTPTTPFKPASDQNVAQTRTVDAVEQERQRRLAEHPEKDHFFVRKGIVKHGAYFIESLAEWTRRLGEMKVLAHSTTDSSDPDHQARIRMREILAAPSVDEAFRVLSKLSKDLDEFEGLVERASPSGEPAPVELTPPETPSGPAK